MKSDTPHHATPELANSDHEKRLAQALGALVEQCEAGGYRDVDGKGFRDSDAFRHAQAVISALGAPEDRSRQALNDDAPGEDRMDGVLPDEPGAWVAEP